MRNSIKETFNILYVSSVDISRPDGPGVNEREFVNVLCETFGERVHLILPQTESVVELDPQLVTFVRPTPRTIWHFLHEIKVLNAIRSVRSSKRIDLIVTRIGLLPLGLALYALTKKIPVVVRVLGDPTLKYLRQKKNLKGLFAKIMRYPHQWMARIIVSRAIAVDSCTPQLVKRNQAFLRIDERKITHIDNATNTKRFRPVPKNVARKQTGLEAFDPIIGFVGGKPWERGGIQMIEALPYLTKNYPNIGCIIVGGGEELEELRRFAMKLHVLEHCVLPGLVPYADVPIWINSFDVGIAFDLSDRMHYVGNSNQKIRQYIACGKPVISTPTGNAFLEESGLGTLVRYEYIPDFVAALRKWIDKTEQEKKEHTKKAVEFAKKYLSVEKAFADRIDFWSQRLDYSTGLGVEK